MRSQDIRGFSLIEMVIVVLVILMVTAIAVVTMQPSLQAAHVANGYNITMAAIREARDYAVAQRQEYSVTFSNTAIPNTITITQVGNGNVLATYQLPTDVAFMTLGGFPTSPAGVPDGFGAGATAIDFDQAIASPVKTMIYFLPDGTGQDANGNINNGVIYVARSNQIYSSRAITFWGATGRIRGWRLYSNGGTNYWRQT